ncbi:MAG: glycine cleavage T C-terminal barrel domain-containing protein [Candidatus Acidiferrum sp.]
MNAESVIETPLATVHRGAVATMGAWFGCELPDSWGDAREEQRFANESVALIDKNYRAYFGFGGPDRARYLNAILTNDIKGLTPGSGTTSLLLNAQGRILAEMETFAGAYGGVDELFCVSYRLIRHRLAEVLEKYIIMDDVTLTDQTEKFGTLAVEGPAAADVVHGLTGAALSDLPELGWREVLVGAIPCRLVKRSATGIAGAEFVAARSEMESLWNAILKAVRQHSGGPMGYQALSAQRLVQGTPWFGYDFGEKQIPHEAALELSHISYTKGCYTGQEIVERVRSRGQVNRRRVELLFSGEGAPDAGAELSVDGKPVGFVTRAAQSWFPPAVLGMGYIGKENRALGTKLDWCGGTATVVEFKDALGR